MTQNRVPLTKKLANTLRRARVETGMSQYELATKLGWVRSKIKRIEKAEVISIPASDLEALQQKLLNGASEEGYEDAPEATPVEKAPKPKPKPSTWWRADGWFQSVKHQKRSASQLDYFEVDLKKPMSVKELQNACLSINGVKGRVIGVEYNSDQGPNFTTGERIVLALFPAGKEA